MPAALVGDTDELSRASFHCAGGKRPIADMGAVAEPAAGSGYTVGLLAGPD